MRRSLTLLLALFGTLVLFFTPPASAAGGSSATFAKTSDWGTSYQAQYTILNGSSATTGSWKVEFDLPAGSGVGSYWDALLTQSGTHYTFTNKTYNGTLAPGASAIFGWVSSGAGIPANCKLNGGSCDAGAPDTTPPSVPGGVTVGSATGSSLTVHWNASTDNSGSVAGYEVSRNGAAPVAVTGTSYTATGLTASTSYSFQVRAKDAAGNTSAYSAAVSGSTGAAGSGGGGGTPGLIRTAPYVDMGAWPTPSLTAMSQASGLKSFTLGFVTSAGCKASWFNAYDPRQAWAKDQIDALRAAGGDVKISFGGASGIELAQACTSVDSLYNEYAAVVDAYGLNYVDFDIEGAAVAEPASIALRSQALARLQQTHPSLRISLTLPVLPTGLTSDGLNVVTQAKNAGVNLDMVNAMAMDYYQNVDYGAAAVQAANAVFSQLKSLYPGKTDAQAWAMVGVTPMLGQNDDGHIYNQAAAGQLVSFAQSKHLGMLSFWEEGRDANACSGALYKCTNISQSPYEFSKIFAAYTG
jgi:chitodextrinase